MGEDIPEMQMTRKAISAVVRGRDITPPDSGKLRDCSASGNARANGIGAEINRKHGLLRRMGRRLIKRKRLKSLHSDVCRVLDGLVLGTVAQEVGESRCGCQYFSLYSLIKIRISVLEE
jgi:hypothetical protein